MALISAFTTAIQQFINRHYNYLMAILTNFLQCRDPVFFKQFSKKHFEKMGSDFILVYHCMNFNCDDAGQPFGWQKVFGEASCSLFFNEKVSYGCLQVFKVR